MLKYKITIILIVKNNLVNIIGQYVGYITGRTRIL